MAVWSLECLAVELDTELCKSYAVKSLQTQLLIWWRRYHSQSPESLFTHIPGLRVVMPRSPSQAKGLLLASIASNDPVIFMEPKTLYRAAREEVPTEAYTLPLSKAEILKSGNDVTIISYGTPLYACSAAIAQAEKDFGCSVELIDLRTIYPWDRPCILESVNKTGRAIVVHESMVNAGVGAEVAATIQENCFLRLEAPVQRVAGWSTHVGLVYEKFLMPDVVRKFDFNLCTQIGAEYSNHDIQAYMMRSKRQSITESHSVCKGVPRQMNKRNMSCKVSCPKYTVGLPKAS